MAKTKMKLAASVVALMVAAVALIGVAYAAYTATLSDTESVTANNYYVTLGDTVTANANIAIEWNSANDVDAGTITYTTAAGAAYLASVKITADNSKIGNYTNTTFELAITGLTIKNGNADYTITGATIKVYEDQAMTQEIADTSALAYMDNEQQDKTYYLGLAYGANTKTVAPPATLTVSFTISAEANIAAQQP